MKHFKTFLLLPLVLVACGSGLNVVSYRGNPEKSRVERDIGGGKQEGLYANDPRFATMQCFFDHDVARVHKLYQRAKKAGVKVDDL